MSGTLRRLNQGDCRVSLSLFTIITLVLLGGNIGEGVRVAEILEAKHQVGLLPC
jgi:hypothetical protein